jgi:6-phosphogluconolactonase
MRMKFNKSSQLGLVAAASLLAATLLTACSQLDETLTVDFVFVASSKAAGANNYGQIDVFEINSESGKMRHIPASPFPSGGRDPVSEAVSADYGSLFVANQDDNSIVQFVIGTDGKLYPFNTVNTPGIFPVAIAADKADLFVVDTYQPLAICSTADPCSGSIGVFPLTTATSSAPVVIGAPATNVANSANYWPIELAGSTDIVAPTAINLVSGSNDGTNAYVYVTAYDSSVSPTAGYVFGFQVGSGGVLTALPGSPYAAGTQPSAIASDHTGTYVYATDFVKGNVLGFWVVPPGSSPTSPAMLPSGTTCPALTPGGMPQTGTTTDPPGTLCTLGGSPFPAGNQPTAIAVNPAYPYAYVVNSLDATVEAYSINNGELTYLGDSPTPVVYGTGSQPVAIGIDPSTERFVFTANFLSNSVSGFELSPAAGTLVESQFSPFTANDWPTAVAAIPHNGTGGGVEPQ